MAKLSSSNGKKANVPKLRFPEFTEEWEEISFSNLFDFLPNNTITRANLSNNGAIRNIHYGDVLIKFGSVLSIKSDDIPFIKITDTVNNNVFLKNGDIVIADTAEDEAVGKVTEICDIDTEKVVSGLHTIPCRTKKNFAPKFLGYYMNSPAYHYQLFPLMQGVKVLSISKSNIVGTVIHYPDILQQTKITNLLSLIDKKISVQRQLVEALKKYKRGLLSALFPKKGEITPQCRFAGFTKPWEQRKAKDLCSISTGKSNTQDRVADGIYPFYVRSPIVEHSNRYLFDEEAVLTVGDGVGTGKVFHYVNGKYDLHQRVYRMFDFSEEIKAKYFYYYFSNHFYDRVMAMTAKTSVDSVRYEMIADMDIALPKIQEQIAISDYFDQLDNLITLHQHKYDTLLSLKNALLQQMFI